MKRIVCKSCGNNNDFPDSGIRPSECSFCFSEFDVNTSILEVDNNFSESISHIRFTCQKTAKVFELAATKKLLLGREHGGCEVFSDILNAGKPVISRLHASLELIDNKVYIKDENSLNGTFVGTEKISCKENTIEITNNSLVFFGKEPFLVTFTYVSKPDKSDILQSAHIFNSDVVENATFLCNYCGLELGEAPSNKICPGCNSFNSFFRKT